MILNIKAKDIRDGDYVLIGESDYRVFPLWVMNHSANYAGRRLQISTGIGIVRRRYAERIIVWRYDCFEEQRRLQLESCEERSKRTRWYEENIIDRYSRGGRIDSKGFIRPVGYPQAASKMH
jgi:hypothetical protein